MRKQTSALPPLLLSALLTLSLMKARRNPPIHLTHLCLLRSRWTDTVPLLPINSLTLLPFSDSGGGGGAGGGLRLMNGALCLSDPFHFIPDGLQGCKVVAEGAAELELMTGLCSALGLLSG